MAELNQPYESAMSIPVVAGFDLMNAHAKNNEPNR